MGRQLDATKAVLDRATVLPFLVRCGIGLAGLIAMTVAWPAELMTSQWSVIFSLVAIYPAVAPRGRGATLSALTVVAGWLVDTGGFGAPTELWRVLTIATMLYIGHSLTALAAQLPFDAQVNLDVPGIWLARTGAVVLISAVLTVLVLGLTDDLAGDAFLVATLVGLAGAVGATILLARLIRRP
jgi:hypothetical protein